jgi:polar amino acid transport system permease protein
VRNRIVEQLEWQPGKGFYLVYIAVVLVFGGAIAICTGSTSVVPNLVSGAAVTAEITLLSALLALPCAFGGALIRLYGPAWARWVAVGYVEVFRGTSGMVQLFWLYFVLPQFGLQLAPRIAAIVGLGLHIGAYGAEIVRGAVSAVSRGQWEAAVALNISPARTFWRIILPQALLAMTPPWGNLLIELLKMTSLVSMIAVFDLTSAAQRVNLATFQTITTFTLLLLGYLILSLAMTIGVRLCDESLRRCFRSGR